MTYCKRKKKKCNLYFIFNYAFLFFLTFFYDLKYENKKFVAENTQNSFKKETCNPIKRNYNNASSNVFRIENQTYPKSVVLHKNKSIDFNCLNTNQKSKVILFWSKYYNKKDHGYGIGRSEPFRRHGCLVTNCELTADKSRLMESDFVIVHILEMRQRLTQSPRTRLFKQRYRIYSLLLDKLNYLIDTDRRTELNAKLFRRAHMMVFCISSSYLISLTFINCVINKRFIKLNCSAMSAVKV